MAYEQHVGKITGMKAAADLSAKQYFLVKASVTNAGEVALVAATTDEVLGVLQNKPVAGEEAEIVAIGQTKVSADAAVALGAVLQATANGQVDDTGTGQRVGLALEAATAAGGTDLITAWINCGGSAAGS